MAESAKTSLILGNRLSTLCAQSSTEVLLCAPFIKVDALRRTIHSMPKETTLKCVTRWRPDEIAIGVSDLEVWPLLRDRGNSSLWLCPNLHAKYYRGDNNCLVGSANITAAALGWSAQPNVELLVSMSPGLEDFEWQLFAICTEVDNSIYLQMRSATDLITRQPKTPFPDIEAVGQLDFPEQTNTPSSPDPYWIPHMRNPEELFLAYSGHTDRLSTASREAAAKDLTPLAITPGLPKDAFQAYVGVLLLQQPVIKRIDSLVASPQRFGAVRDAIKSMVPNERLDFDANRAWQTLMRWLRFFLPNRYAVATPRHSEVFYRKQIEQ